MCENLKVTAALLSRFDLVFVLLDKADEGRDKLISEHIMRTTRAASAVDPVNSLDDSNSRWRSAPSHPSSESGTLTLAQSLRRSSSRFEGRTVPQSLLREYIAYARQYCNPR